jgi:uncharacterized protein (DUF697 family)
MKRLPRGKEVIMTAAILSENNLTQAERILSEREEKIMSAEEKRKARAHQAVIDGAVTAAWAGFIFVPFIDGLFVAGVQLKMIYEVCTEYEVRFSDHLGKAVLAAFFSGIIATIYEKINLSTATTLSLGVAGNFGLIMISGALTYAIGQAFSQHLEAGGTLLDFNAEKSKEYFAEMYEEGKNVVSFARAKRRMRASA